MLTPIRRTQPTLAVLRALVEAGEDELYAWAVGERTHLASGTVTPILARLREGGWATDRWEQAPPGTGRPARRYYHLTTKGRRAAVELLAEPERRRR